MQYKKLGITDIDASVVGFGAWAIGGWMWGGTEEKDAMRAIDAAIDHGINLIDTAPMYGYGRSEEIIGKTIASKREKVVLATKCGLRWDDQDWPPGKGVLHFYGSEKGISKPGTGTRVYKYLQPDSIRDEVDQSLKRLNTDYIDLLQTHWQDETTPISVTMEALLKLKESGKIRAIGVSNVSPLQLQEYQKIGLVDVAQERYSMIDRKLEQNGLFELCKNNGVSLLAYSPMANGLLTGRISPERRFNEGDLRLGHPRFTTENVARVNNMLNDFSSIARKYDVSIGQVVIAWTVGRYEKMHVLCGARTESQAIENAAAGSVALTNDEMLMIDDVVKNAKIS